MSGQPIDHIHLVFKTHLDLGFTNFANAVLQRYLNDFIPGALRLARRLREKHDHNQFVWTTGSWLIDTYLEQSAPSARREMEAAILAGDMVWHALPFTLHSEFMDADLFRFGLSFSQRLDARFGRHTIAAKMTDVPGHTRAIVPLLAEAGVEFLHIGVNEASAMPQVPPLFRWLDEASGKSVTMMYHANYGEETTLPELGTALAIAFTGDNIGPPDENSVELRYRDLQSRYPNATVTASTLDAFARELRQIRDTLPVITSEIGDTWIHGLGTDPSKVRRFRELSRLRQHGLTSGKLHADEPAHDRFSSALLCVAEHTWGLDTKTHLKNYTDYAAPAFSAARTRPEFQAMESSWAEQRSYLDQAVAALAGTPLHAEALAVLHTIAAPQQGSTAQITPARTFKTPLFEIAFDPQTGAISRLRTVQDGREWADATHPLALFQYETFSQADYDRFWAQYVRNAHREDIRVWAFYDQTKPGIAGHAQSQRLPPSQLVELRCLDNSDFTRFFATLALPTLVTTQYGAPPQVFLNVTCHHTKPQIEIELGWPDKPACRLPEAGWLSFVPLQAPAAAWQIEKLGQWIDPMEVVAGGNRNLHGVNNRLRYRDAHGGLTLTTLDAPLVAPGSPRLLHFDDMLPDMSGGVHLNLFNNVWATNFPLWIEGPAAFRFELCFA